MTIINNPYIGPQENIESDMTPTALFRGGSFDTITEAEGDSSHHRLDMTMAMNHPSSSSRSSLLSYDTNHNMTPLHSNLNDSTIHPKGDNKDQRYSNSNNSIRSPLHNRTTAEAANILFPQSSNPSTSSPLSQSYSRSESPPLKENINLNTTSVTYENDDTVVTDTMAFATDEDSFDISPVPTSPSRKMQIPSSNSRKRTSSDRKKNINRTFDVNHASSGIGNFLSSIDVSKDHQGNHHHVVRNRNMPPPLPRSLLEGHSNNNMTSGGTSKTKNQQQLTFRSIESSQSFDSHDSSSNSTSNIINDVLQSHYHYDNYTNHHNEVNASSSSHSQQSSSSNHHHQLRHPQSIHYPNGWSSSFGFSGSPIEEEDCEDCSPSDHYNIIKKPKIVLNNGVHGDNNDVGSSNGAIVGDEDHFSSKIRKLNLDCEMNGMLASAKHGSVSATPCKADDDSTMDCDVKSTKGSLSAIVAGDDQEQTPGMVKRESFRLHVNTDFDAMDDEDGEANTKGEQGISPNDVMDFSYASSSSHPSTCLKAPRTIGRNNHREATSTPVVFSDEKIARINMDTPMQRENSCEIMSPPSTFSSPTPNHKKGSTQGPPPSPERPDSRHRSSLLPPNTPMVPQKAMRRMRGHANTFSPDCATPYSQDGLITSNANVSETSRFDTDYEIIGTLGDGSFGTVYKCRSRVDKRMYAIKIAKRRAKGNADRLRMLREVQALSELSNVADTTAFHIVRYHYAWMEEEKLHIATELCTSTLQIEMQNGIFHGNTKRMFKLLREMLLALKLIHDHGLVHLDIKPENIFVREDTFKLGDFGLVSKVTVNDDVEEGDSRYMCMDLLSGNHKDLTKVS